jgi:nitrite reductase/ring-hydroxylating ferredoxin subunit
MAETDLGDAAIEPGSLRAITAGRRELVATRLPSGELRAFGARCPHHGAPLTAACATGAVVADATGAPCMVRDGEVLRCRGTASSSIWSAASPSWNRLPGGR